MKVCTNAYTVIKKDNYFSVTTNSVEIRILFLTDSILRIRAAGELLLFLFLFAANEKFSYWEVFMVKEKAEMRN